MTSYENQPCGAAAPVALMREWARERGFGRFALCQATPFSFNSGAAVISRVPAIDDMGMMLIGRRFRNSASFASVSGGAFRERGKIEWAAGIKG